MPWEMESQAEENVVLQHVHELSNIRLDDCVPFADCQSSSVEVNLAADVVHRSDADLKAFQSKHITELSKVQKLQSLVQSGKPFVGVLYSFRSVSNAIPMVVSFTCRLSSSASAKLGYCRQ